MKNINNKKYATVLSVFIAIMSIVFVGCKATLNDSPPVRQRVSVRKGGSDTVRQAENAQQAASAQPTASGNIEGPLPRNLTLKLNEKYPAEEGKTLKTLGVTRYGDNSTNRIFSLDDDRITANKEGVYTLGYEVGQNNFSITVTVVKDESPEEPKSVPQEKTPPSVPKTASTAQVGRATYADPYTVVTTDWVYGITPPKPGEIVVHDKTYRNWPESQTTTWFNALKLAYSRRAGNFSGISDASLCYGLTAANMLHWWITQNETSLKKRGFEPADLQYRKFADGTESDIAEMVRTGELNHGGAGGDTREVLWWFLNNKFGIDKSETGNFVKDTAVGSKEEFERYLNEAIRNNEAIAVTYYIEGPKPGKHVVNVWGISKDKQGNIVELWIGDSNRADPDDTMRGSKLYPYGIHYHGGRGNPYLVNAGNLGVTGNKIETVIRLNLGQN